MINVKALWTGLSAFVIKNGSTICTTVAVVSSIGNVVETFRVAPKAMDIMEQKKEAMERLNADLCEKVVTEEEFKQHKKNIYISFTKDLVKECWPVVLGLGINIASIACAHKISTKNARKVAALASTLSLTENKFKDYQEKTKEVLGEKKEQKIRDDIYKDKVRNNPVSDVLDTGKGEVLCLDSVSGRYFKCNADFIRNRVNFLNNKLLSEMWISLNELYSELNLPSIKIGEDIGWNINKDGLIEVNFSSQLTEDDKPVLVLDYIVEPRWDYKKLY